MLFHEKMTYSGFPTIVFLCGSKYSKNNPSEKRNILKKYIEEKHKFCKAIILEENFFFSSTNLNYCSYDDVYLYNLEQVEQLASIFADKVIIIHETISTGAELGMFASSLNNPSKICLLVPENLSVDENKVTGFIQLAFFNKKMQYDTIKKIIFYPDVQIKRFSNEKSHYFTFFHNNSIGEHLGAAIDRFIISNSSANEIIQFKKIRFNPSSKNKHIEYIANHKKKRLYVFVSSEALKIQLCSLLSQKSIMTKLRSSKTIKEHVGVLCKKYRQTLKDTICELEGLNSTNFTQYISLKEYDCKIDQVVGYFLYMLQGASLIDLVAPDKNNPALRKVIIKNDFTQIIKQSANLIYEKKESVFERRFR